jgi:hypothetical protein
MPDTDIRTIPRSLPLVCAALLAACGGGIEYAAEGEALAPEAELEVEMAQTAREGHWPMTVEVEELPRPAELGESVRAYAAWAREPGADGPRFLGVLEYDRDARFGQLHTTTPHDRLSVFVTAERSERPSAPSERVVARLDVVHEPS